MELRHRRRIRITEADTSSLTTEYTTNCTRKVEGKSIQKNVGITNSLVEKKSYSRTESEYIQGADKNE